MDEDEAVAERSSDDEQGEERAARGRSSGVRTGVPEAISDSIRSQMRMSDAVRRLNEATRREHGAWTALASASMNQPFKDIARQANVKLPPEVLQQMAPRVEAIRRSIERREQERERLEKEQQQSAEDAAASIQQTSEDVDREAADSDAEEFSEASQDAAEVDSDQFSVDAGEDLELTEGGGETEQKSIEELFEDFLAAQAERDEAQKLVELTAKSIEQGAKNEAARYQQTTETNASLEELRDGQQKILDGRQKLGAATITWNSVTLAAVIVVPVVLFLLGLWLGV